MSWSRQVKEEKGKWDEVKWMIMEGKETHTNEGEAVEGVEEGRTESEEGSSRDKEER